MISVLKSVAARVLRSPLRDDEEVVRYYRGFRISFLPNPGHAAGTGFIEPMSDAAIAAWDKHSNLPLAYEEPVPSAAAFFPRAEGMCDRVLLTRH